MRAGDFDDSERCLDVGPEVEQEAEVAAELFFAGAFGCGADDEAAGGVALFAEENFLQAAAFAVGLDLARDAGVVDGGHEDQEAAGERDVRGDARALLGDGLLGDLDENLLAGLEQVADGGQVGGLHGAERPLRPSRRPPERSRSPAPPVLRERSRSRLRGHLGGHRDGHVAASRPRSRSRSASDARGSDVRRAVRGYLAAGSRESCIAVDVFFGLLVLVVDRLGIFFFADPSSRSSSSKSS